MVFDLCLESYGSLAPFIDSNVGAVVGLRARRRRAPRAAADGRVGSGDRLADRVMAATDQLPFPLVHVLWLIDVCRCTYEEAAAELATTPEIVAERVTLARRAVRAELGSKPPG